MGAALASGHHAPASAHAASKASHSHGLFVANRSGQSQQVESYRTDSALVRDDDGREHVVTTQASKSDPNKGHMVYLTRETDKSNWRAKPIPGIVSMNGGVQVEAHLSYNGQRIFAVFFRCDGVYVSDAAIGASRLPVPTQVKPLDECADPPLHPSNPPSALTGTVIGRDISILLEDQVLGNPVYSIYTGEPNGTFTAGTPLPTTDNFTPTQIAADPQYGRIVVVGTGTDGTNEGIYETYQDRYSDAWSNLAPVASLNSATTDYKIDAVQTYARHTYIGLEKPASSGQVAHRLFLVKGQPSGQWLGAIPLSHTTGDDRYLRLTVNTATRHLHAVWTRTTSSHQGKKGGLMHEAQTNNKWSKPIYLTHDSHDVATQITLTNGYHPIVGYVQ
jgi:hypothetical protein